MKCYNCQSSVHVIDVNIYLWGNANVWRCKEFDIKTYIYYAFESKHVKIKKFAGYFLYKFMMLGRLRDFPNLCSHWEVQLLQHSTPILA
jgi:hypothetical protein